MISYNHLLMGVLLGLHVSNPIMIIVLALLLHFVMDLFPFFFEQGRPAHMSKGLYRQMTPEQKYAAASVVGLQLVACGFLLVFLYSAGFLIIPNVLLGMVFSILPDAVNIALAALGIPVIFHHAHYVKISPRMHAVVQHAFTVAAAAVVLSL